MFEMLVGTAERSRSAAAAVGAWARVENAACARRLFAMADELERQLAADGSAEREQWCLDNWDAVAASVAAEQSVSLGVAAHQLLIAHALRERLSRVAEVFAAGAISYRLVAAVVARTRLIRDPDAMAKVDTEIAAHVVAWGSLSAVKTQTEIDYWVDRYDPAAVRRTEDRVRGCHVDIGKPDDGSGTADIDAQLLATDAEALDQRLDAMAAAVCANDPRTPDQRRAAALAAFGHGADRVVCACDNSDCDAAGVQPSAVVVHVITREESLTDDTPARLDGEEPPSTPWQAGVCTADEPSGPAATPPAALLGGGMLPAPLLAAKIAGTAKLVPIVHPGDTAPEPRYIPTAALAWFVRCRDMTCRFPGCDEPAHHCDIDHTIAYPAGPTQASNLKCLCRKHHLIKTFWGWRDRQEPDGTVVWTSPRGQTYTTRPGSRLLFPTLCRPTAAVTASTNVPDARRNRTLMMPRRRATRAQDRAERIDAERSRNQELRESPGNDWEGGYFASRPRPPSDNPPPF